MKSHQPSSQVLEFAASQICPTLVFSNYHTPPVPTHVNGETVFAILIGRGEHANPNSGYQIWKPHLLCGFAITDGSFLELRRIGVEPAGSEQPLGTGVSPIEQTSVEIQGARIKYCQLVDRLLAGGLPCSGEMRADLLGAFVKCSGPVLAGCFDRYFMRDGATPLE